jgi:hypothetical protein
MKKIERPLTVDEVSTMLHLAEYMLTQVNDILANIVIAPESAGLGPLGGNVWRMGQHVKKALKELESETES